MRARSAAAASAATWRRPPLSTTTALGIWETSSRVRLLLRSATHMPTFGIRLTRTPISMSSTRPATAASAADSAWRRMASSLAFDCSARPIRPSASCIRMRTWARVRSATLFAP